MCEGLLMGTGKAALLSRIVVCMCQNHPTFGRCAENPVNRLTFGRWKMVKISENGCVRAVSVPLLKPTFGRCAENPEDRLTFGRWEMVKISGNGCVRAVSVPLLNPTFGRCAENPEDRLTFERWD